MSKPKWTQAVDRVTYVTKLLTTGTLLLCMYASPVHASVVLNPSPPPYDPETYGYYEEEPAPVGVEPPEGSSDLGKSTEE